MKRAILLGITAMMWVVASQIISGATAPAREIDLTAPELTTRSGLLFSVQGVGVALEGSLDGYLDRLGRSPASTFEQIPIPSAVVSSSTTSTTALPVPETTPSTTAPPVTTTTRQVPTTAPPATTAPPPTTAPTVTPPPTATTAPPVTTAPTSSGTFDSSAETDFLGRINGLRGSVGEGALTSNGDLHNYARWWAKQMADTNTFAHSNIGSLLNPWTIVGENIANGGTVALMFNGLVNSSGHYNNMVETRFTAVGVGVYEDASGRLWTCHVFAG